MTTLLLASNGTVVDHHIVKIVNKPPEEIKVAYVTTASLDAGRLSNKNRQERLDGHIKNMTDQGLEVEEIDVKGKTQAELTKILADKNVVYVAGGDSFYLLKAVRDSGFAEVIKALVSQGVVYAGASAGAYLACPTMDMATWKRGEDYRAFGLDDLKALNLVPFLIVAHYIEELRDILAVGVMTSAYPVRILKDGQGFLVKDDQVEFIGEGDEVRLIG